MNTSWSFGWLGIHFNASISVDPFDLQIRYAYDVAQVGHLSSRSEIISHIKLILRKISLMNTGVPR